MLHCSAVLAVKLSSFLFFCVKGEDPRTSNIFRPLRGKRAGSKSTLKGRTQEPKKYPRKGGNTLEGEDRGSNPKRAGSKSTLRDRTQEPKRAGSKSTLRDRPQEPDKTLENRAKQAERSQNFCENFRTIKIGRL